jgi:hypothetical protein
MSMRVGKSPPQDRREAWLPHLVASRTAMIAARATTDKPGHVSTSRCKSGYVKTAPDFAALAVAEMPEPVSELDATPWRYNGLS